MSISVPTVGTGRQTPGRGLQRPYSIQEGIQMTKLRILSVGLLAALVACGFAVVNAGATTGGHFVSGASKTTIKGTENTTHRLEFKSHGLEGGIVCDETSYTGSAGATETEIPITPSWTKCHTTGEEPTTWEVHENGCGFTFKVAPGDPKSTEHTVDITCPANKAIVITHPNCTITVPAQTSVSSVTYSPDNEGSVPAITLNSKTQFKTEYHGGICIFTGTNHVGTLEGSATVKGFAGEEQVSIAAT
jgi:hypothetical protein